MMNFLVQDLNEPAGYEESMSQLEELMGGK